MLSTVDIRSPRVRIVLLAVLLILAPGVVLAVVGVRSIANRAEGLRTNYAVTVALVRDRVEAELNRLESDVTTMAQAFVAEPRAGAELTAWLQARVADSEWLEAPFFVPQLSEAPNGITLRVVAADGTRGNFGVGQSKYPVLPEEANLRRRK